MLGTRWQCNQVSYFLRKYIRKDDDDDDDDHFIHVLYLNQHPVIYVCILYLVAV